jgi:hypothetical protein
MPTKVIRNNLFGWFYGKQTKVAIVGLLDEYGLLLALAPQSELDGIDNPRLDEYFTFGMGHTDHLLGENYFTDQPDEIAIYPMMGGKWKAEWLIEQGLATAIDKTLEKHWSWPVVKLEPNFFAECAKALGFSPNQHKTLTR